MENDNANSPNPPTQDAGWAYTAEDAPLPPQQGAPPQQESIEPIKWTGSEFIAHQKDTGWYVALIGGVVAIAVIMYFTIHDVIAIVAVIVAGLLFAVIAGRDPKQRAFTIDDKGITVDSKFFSYGDFKSFTLLRDGAIGYIDLIPLKRFMPELSLYFAPNDEQRIFEALASYLPNEQREEHRVDRLMRKLKF